MGNSTTVPVLLTPRLRLEPCRVADRADFVALERDPEVMRFLSGGVPVDQLELQDIGFLTPRGTEPYIWSARSTAGRQFVGWFSLRPDDKCIAELGYRLKRDSWGCGLASEGAAAVIKWGCQAGRYDKLIAETMAANHASRRVLEKLGFTYRRTIYADYGTPIPGNEDGEVEYELTCRGRNRH